METMVIESNEDEISILGMAEMKKVAQEARGREWRLESANGVISDDSAPRRFANGWGVKCCE